MLFDMHTYVEQFVDELIKKMNQEERVSCLLIKHYNSFQILERDIEAIDTQYEDIMFLYHSYDSSQIIRAYEPFLDWIRQLYLVVGQEHIDTIMDECNVYPLQREVIKSYILAQKTRRTEKFIYNEIIYEKQRMLQGIANILCYFAKKQPLVFVLNKLHRCDISCLAMLEQLLQMKSDRIAIICTYNDLVSPDSHIEKQWNQFINHAKENKIIIDWGLSTALPREERSKPFNFKMENMPTYIVQIENMFNMVALEQAYYYASVLYHKIQLEDLMILEEYKYRICELYAEISIYNGDTSNALLLCEALNKLNTENNAKERQFHYYYLFTLAHVYNGQNVVAQKYAKKCREIATAYHDPYLSFKADLLSHMTDFLGWNDIWLCEIAYEVDPVILVT